MDPQTTSRTHLRGFASMDPERQRQIASMGGQHAHRIGKAHKFTSEEAAAAGRKGGTTRARNRQLRQAQEAQVVSAPATEQVEEAVAA
jgi:general stress protein YciG